MIYHLKPQINILLILGCVGVLVGLAAGLAAGRRLLASWQSSLESKPDLGVDESWNWNTGLFDPMLDSTYN